MFSNADGSNSAVQPSTGTQIPYEDILVPPHLLPPNPEDEDDVVPDQHAAFGIARAMAASREDGSAGRGRNGERIWKAFESLDDIVRGVGLGNGVGGQDKAPSIGGVGGGTRISSMR